MPTIAVQRAAAAPRWVLIPRLLGEVGDLEAAVARSRATSWTCSCRRCSGTPGALNPCPVVRDTRMRSPTRSSATWTRPGFERAHLVGNSSAAGSPLSSPRGGRALSTTPSPLPAGGTMGGGRPSDSGGFPTELPADQAPGPWRSAADAAPALPRTRAARSRRAPGRPVGCACYGD